MEDLFQEQIPLMKPWLGAEEWNSLKDVILSGWVSQGPKVEEFEKSIASFVGAEFAVATNSCTSALCLALVNHGVGPGDEVILPDSTCMANANAIVMLSAIPVFADIDEKTYNIDPDKTEHLINAKTKAIMVVDQIGLPSDLGRFIDIARKYNLALIDDAATALGAKYKGKYLGGHGITSTFSFHPRKMITTGEGGMLITNNEKCADNARILRSAGASVSDLERHKAKGIILQKYFTNGYNFRMTDIQAAIGIIQMRKLTEILIQRKKQAEIYNNALADIDEIEIPFVPEYAEPAYSSYLLKVKKHVNITTVQIINQMAANNISCRFGIQPLHREPYFKNRALHDKNFPVSCDVADNSFFIPVFPGLSEDNQNYIIKCLKDIFCKYKINNS